MDFTLRPARWPDDERGAAALDFSYATDRVYRLHRGPLSFRFTVEPLASPLRKVIPSLAADIPQLRAMEHVVVAEGDRDASPDASRDGAAPLLGLVAANLEAWNRRVRVEHLVVAPHARGRGIGRALLDSAEAFARERGAWCVWLETQADNYPALQFYQRLGFRLCGLDECLYDPESPAAGDLAVFLARDLDPPTPGQHLPPPRERSGAR